MEDCLGNPVTGDAAALRPIDGFIRSLLTYVMETQALRAAANADPDHALLNAYAGILMMLLEAPEAPRLARPFVERAVAAAPRATAREAGNVRFLAQWWAGDIAGAAATAEAVAAEHPRDLVMVKLAQYHLFNRGDAPGMLRVALRSEAAAGDVGALHGMIAFGYEECHLIDRAETAARRALALTPTDAWSHHALAHVHLARGTVDEGTAFLDGVAPAWDALNSFMHTHNWWHLALFRLSRGEEAAVLDIYDRHVWAREPTYSQDQVGAASLLARMEIAGIDVGDRWADVAARVAARGPDTVQPFLSLQYLYALARAGRSEADALFAAIEAAAAADRVWAEVALPAARPSRARRARLRSRGAPPRRRRPAAWPPSPTT
jgi:hypothetical protein